MTEMETIKRQLYVRVVWRWVHRESVDNCPTLVSELTAVSQSRNNTTAC